MDYSLPLSLALLLLSGLTAGDIRMDSLQYVGCFELSYSLSMNYHEHLPAITFEECVNACERMGAPRYIGIESSDDFCYCGGDIAEQSIKREDSLCNVPCSNTSNRTCGGEWLMSVYDTHKNIHVTDEKVYESFLIGLSSGIRVYNSTRISEYDTVMVTNNSWAYTVDYHYARKLVFTNTKGKLLMVQVSPSFGAVNMTPSLVRELSQCDGFAVDWVADKIYWFDCVARRSPNVMRMNLDGSNNEMVVSLGGAARGVKRVEIDPYNGMLFWLADGVIESLNLTTKEYRTNVSDEGVVVRALALERTTQKVYYIGVHNQITPLFSMDYNGDSDLKVFSVPQMQSVFGLGIQGEYIYWVNYAMSTDIIYRAPLHMEGGRDVKMMQTINKAVWHMRVVHPDIQKVPGNNPCTNKRCSMFCRVMSPTVAECQCSPGYELALNKRSCIPTDPVLPIFSHLMTPPTTTTTTTEMPRDIVYGNATYVGCFGTSNTNNHFKIHFITLDKCINRCVSLKSRYAGIGVRDMNCYCGDDLAPRSIMHPRYLCSERCPGTQGSYPVPCGGSYLMSLYDIINMLPKPQEPDNDKSVTILLGHSDCVRTYNSTNLNYPRQRINTRPHEWAYGVDYHYRQNLMFMASRRALYKAPLFNRDPQITTFTEVMKMGTCEGFAIDWVFDRIFWADCSEYDTTIKVAHLDGENPTSIGESLSDGMVKRMEIDPNSGVLFWVRNDVLESCGTSGENFQSNVSSTSRAVREIALDIHNKRMFFNGIEGGLAYLMSVDYEGNNLKTYFEIQEMRNVYGLSVVSGFAYWVNYQSVDVLYKAPLDFTPGSQRQLKVFGSGNTVWHMRVVDPELQSSPGSGSCHGSSCQAQRVETTQRNIAEAVLKLSIVIGGVLIGGLLMYITDKKYWNLLGTRVPYTRENGMDTDGTPTYHTTEDTVNLI